MPFFRRWFCKRTPQRPRLQTRLGLRRLEPRIVMHAEYVQIGDLIYCYLDEPADGDETAPLGHGVTAMGQPTITYTTRADGLPELTSRSGAAATIYLDFDGDPIVNPGGFVSTPYDEDGSASTFGLAEQRNIVEIWRRTASYYSMFDLNVTTILPANLSTTPTVWQVITNSSVGVGAAGVAQLNTFPNTQARAWTTSSSARNLTGSTVAHEAGHVFGLRHQSDYDALGNLIDTYKEPVDTTHGIVMGGGTAAIDNWYWGFTNTNTTLQDDIALIANDIRTFAGTGYTGDGYAPDDYGGSIATALALNVAGAAQAGRGVLEKLDDLDFFSFSSAGGTYAITAVRYIPVGVDLRVTVYDSLGNILAAQDGDPLDFTSRFNNDQYLTLELAAGTYYVGIASHGNYDDLGEYLVAVNPMADNWQSQTVGRVIVPGYAAYDASSGLFTVAGAGASMSEGMHYVWKTLTGDGSIVARVAAVELTNALANAGVMIRESLGAASKFFATSITADRGAQRTTRTSDGATSVSTTQSATSIGFTPTWIRITRAGNSFQAATSTNGISWTNYGTAVTISMAAEVTIGLFSAAITTGQLLNIAQLSDVALTGTINSDVEPTYGGGEVPTGLQVTAATATSVSLAWNAAAGATGYTLQRSSDGVNYRNVASLSGNGNTTYVDQTGLVAYERYFYRVAAADSAPSAAVVTTTRASAPIVTLASVSQTQLVVKIARAEGETGFRVERSLDQLNWTTLAANLAANSPAYVDSGLTSGVRYYYRVTSLDLLGDSGSATLSTTTRIDAVTGLAISTVTTSQIAFSWNSSASATAYRVDRSTDGSNFTTVVASQTDTTFSQSSLNAFTKYYYLVYGINADGALGMNSTRIIAATQSLTPPPEWAYQDIGVTGRGAASLSSGTYTVATNGNSFGSTSDLGGFLWQSFVGDAQVTARVDTIGSNIGFTGSSASNSAGVMIRDGLDANSSFAFARRTNSGSAALEYRTGPGLASVIGTTTSVSGSYWLRLTRTGGVFTAEGSTDGANWTTLATTTLAMGQTIYVGLASESDTQSLLTNSTFSNVSVTGTDDPFALGRVGSEIRIDSTPTSLLRSQAALATDGGGNYVVAWTSTSSDGTGTNIYARRFAADGTPQGAEFLVNTGRTTGDQVNPSVAMDVNGAFVIAWQDDSGGDGSGKGIYHQRYNSAGAAQGSNTITSSSPTGDQTKPFVAMATTGYVVAYTRVESGSELGVYFRRYNSTGTAQGNEVKANATNTANQLDGRIFMEADGRFTLTWTSVGQDGSLEGVYARRFSASGTPLTNEFLVNQTVAGPQQASAVAVASNGTTLVTWISGNQDGGGWGVYARLFDASGNALTGEWLVNQTTAGDQTAPAVSVDGDNNFLVVWQSAGATGSTSGIFARRYSSAGTALTDEFRITPSAQSDIASPAVAVSRLGLAVVAWQGTVAGSTQGIYVQRLADNVVPTVTGVYVRGSTWTAEYLGALAAQGSADAAYGIAVSLTAAPSRLFWTNVNQLVIRFSEGVSVVQSMLSLVGSDSVTGAVPGLAGFTLVSADTAVWTLSSALTLNKWLIRLDAAVADALGATLGQPFDIRIDAAPGDVNGNGTVNNIDQAQLRANAGRSLGEAGYNPRFDLNGNGTVNNIDRALGRAGNGATVTTLDDPEFPGDQGSQAAASDFAPTTFPLGDESGLAPVPEEVQQHWEQPGEISWREIHFEIPGVDAQAEISEPSSLIGAVIADRGLLNLAALILPRPAASDAVAPQSASIRPRTPHHSPQPAIIAAELNAPSLCTIDPMTPITTPQLTWQGEEYTALQSNAVDPHSFFGPEGYSKKQAAIRKRSRA